MASRLLLLVSVCAFGDGAIRPGSSIALRMGCARLAPLSLRSGGASEAQLNAIFGWAENSNESRRYTRAARQKVLASSATELLSTTEPGTKTVPLTKRGTKKGKKSGQINV